ncbi:MAG: iron-sulfur cluster assembly scaffold protein, partial [Pseudomonadota bacterium]|nr:iron-sulfur cluster assembly scaffold protein [Pseudomonadota bacterium]
FEVLIPARDFKNRHASIMLALDATLEAMQSYREQTCA